MMTMERNGKTPLEQALARADVRGRRDDAPGAGLHCSLLLEPDQVRPLALALARQDFFIEAVTAVDRIEEERMEGIYLFNHYQGGQRLLARVPVSRTRPVLPSIGRIFPGAVWHERETAEMFGIVFADCPDSRHLLLPDDADFHPLRKDFTGDRPCPRH